MKIKEIKNSYKAFIRKLIAEHDDEAYMAKDVLLLCEKAGYDITLERVLGMLEKCAKRIKYDGDVWWGNEKAIAKIEESE